MNGPIPGLHLNFLSNQPADVATTVELFLLLTILSLAPAILVLMTSFTRIVIILSFVRTAMATRQMPPNQVLIGLSLFLTFFIMAPVIGNINSNAVQPFMKGKITQQAALQKAEDPLRQFMAKHTRQKDLQLFMKYGHYKKPEKITDIPMTAMVPAFTISELKTAFEIGFMIYVPFLVIDMVVASILMSMGMMMLPPVMISLPFKILLFVLVDGWYLVVKSILLSYQ